MDTKHSFHVTLPAHIAHRIQIVNGSSNVSIVVLTAEKQLKSILCPGEHGVYKSLCGADLPPSDITAGIQLSAELSARIEQASLSTDGM